MKRFLLLLLTICMLGTMTGCGSKEKKVTRGTIDGDVYTSEFLGLSFTKPESWVYSTDEEIAQVMNVGADVLDQSEFEKKAAELTTIYDMMVKDLNWGNNISVAFENLKMSQASNITVDQYIDQVTAMMKEQASMMNYEFADATEVKLGDQTFSKVAGTGSYSGVTFQQNFYLRKEGVYMVLITITAFDGTDMSEYEAMFK